MQKLRFGICFAGIVAVMTMISARALADDKKSIDDAYQALAVQRTKAEVACDKAAKALDSRENGSDDTDQAIADLHAKIADVFGKAIRAESAKEEGVRNQALIDELNGQVKQLDQDWQAFTRDQQKMIGAHNRLNQQFSSQRNAFEGLVNQEKSWKDGGLDLTVLGSAYDAVTAAVDANEGKVQQQVDDLKAKQKDWESKLAAATKAAEPPK